MTYQKILELRNEKLYDGKRQMTFNAKCNFTDTPVTLQDVLRLLPYGRYSVDSAGTIMKLRDVLDGEWAYDVELNKIDLTKSIEDQDEETLKSILSLIK